MTKASPPQLCIEFLRGSRHDEKLELQGTSWQIGTSPNCAILFDMILDAEVHDRHAEITLKDGQYWIIPIAASQTWLNGALLQNQQQLKHGDKVIFGTEDGRKLPCI
jgi:predicted component of type VI protein secretion system